MKRCDFCNKEKPDVREYEVGKDVLVNICTSCKNEIFPQEKGFEQPKMLSSSVDKKKLVDGLMSDIQIVKERMASKSDSPQYTSYDAIGDFKVVRALKSLVFDIESGKYDGDYE
jgi:hypothetical protein